MGIKKAIKSGDIEAVRRALDEIGGERDGRILICDAAKTGHRGICELLLDRGESVEGDDYPPEDKTPLILAAERGHTDVCRLLIERGCRLDWYDHYYHTALHYAIMGGYKDICSLLLENGADVNCTGGWEWWCKDDERDDRPEEWFTPICMAESNSDIMELLLSYGARYDPRDYNDDSDEEDDDDADSYETAARRRMDLLTLMAADDVPVNVREEEEEFQSRVNSALRILDKYGGECGGQESRFQRAVIAELGKKRSRE